MTRRKIEDLMNQREPIVEECVGCKSIEKTIVEKGNTGIIMDACKVYLFPEKKWHMGDCPVCSNEHKVTVDQCEMCDNIERADRDKVNSDGSKSKVKVNVCRVYISPDKKWENEDCRRLSYKNTSGKINPIKASRRSMKK